MELASLNESHRSSAYLKEQHVQPPGRMIEIDGHAMHLLAKGTGGPTVVLETGASGYFGAWEWVQEEVAKKNRVHRPAAEVND